MRALNRKLFRDLRAMKGPAAAILLVVAAGIAVFVASMSAVDSLDLSRAAYYEEHRFADVFARLVRAPGALERQIAAIPGVARVQTRVVADVSLDLPDLLEPATGRLISVPERGEPELNTLYLRSGRPITPGREDEALLGEAFAVAHGLGPGGSISAIVGGRRRQLTIVGIALSPEYVYQISGADPFPDDRRFAILWMGEEGLSAALDLRGGFNDATLALSHGASEPDVIAALDRLLDPYGGLGAHGRDRQISHQLLSDELQQLRATGLIIPSIFLGVAAFLLHVVVSRLVSTQRTQIATLKAFGYGNAAIGLHYLGMAFALVLAGAALGTAGGLWLGGAMTRLYAGYFRFPVLELRVVPATVLLGVAVSAAAAAVGVLTSVRRASSLPPAEAMRPEAPPDFHAGRGPVSEAVGRLLSPAGRMIVRNVARRPARAALSVVGVAMAVAIVIVGSFSEHAINTLVDLQFRVVQREDATVIFRRPRTSDAVRGLSTMPGVLRAEPMRAVPVTLRAGHRSHRTAIVGMPSGAELRRLVDRDGREVRVPPEGVVLSTYLAEELRVGLGDELLVEVMEGRRREERVRVTALLDELMGATVAMEIGALNRLLGEGDVVTGGHIAVDALGAEALYGALKRAPEVAGVGVRRASLENFERLMEENLGVLRAIQLVFAVIIAVSVLYNTARIALAERSRELASLRVLGFTRGEVSLILLGELSLTTAAAIPLGFVLGYGLSWLAATGLRTEMFRMPLVIEGSTYVRAAAVVVAATAASALQVRRQIHRLDLVGVLKTRD